MEIQQVLEKLSQKPDCILHLFNFLFVFHLTFKQAGFSGETMTQCIHESPCECESCENVIEFIATSHYIESYHEL